MTKLLIILSTVFLLFVGWRGKTKTESTYVKTGALQSSKKLLTSSELNISTYGGAADGGGFYDIVKVYLDQPLPYDIRVTVDSYNDKGVKVFSNGSGFFFFPAGTTEVHKSLQDDQGMICGTDPVNDFITRTYNFKIRSYTYMTSNSVPPDVLLGISSATGSVGVNCNQDSLYMNKATFINSKLN